VHISGAGTDHVKVVIYIKIGKYGKEIGENRNFHIVGIDTASASVFEMYC